MRYSRTGADFAPPSSSSPLLVATGLESLGRRAVEGDAAGVRPVADVGQPAAQDLHPRGADPRGVGYNTAAADPPRTVDRHAHTLRHKLEQAGAQPMVQSVRGVGWRLTQ